MAKTCGICKKIGAPYKCPICREPYCSTSCCKTHKVEGCKMLESPQETEKASISKLDYDFPTEDTVPKEKLERLRDSQELKECLKNPHVRNIMKAILTDSNPTKAIALAMTEPIFVEVADACLKIVEPPDDQKPC